MTMLSLFNSIDLLIHELPLVAEFIDLGSKSIFIVCMGFLLTWFGKKQSASTLSLIWTMVFAALIALPFLHTLLPSFHIAIHSEPVVAVMARKESSLFSVQIATAAVYIYVAVFSLLLIKLLVGVGRAFGLSARAKPLYNNSIQRLLEACMLKNGLNAKVELLLSDEIESPVTWGVINHKILFPARVYQWDQVLLEQVISHELGHIQRRDWLKQLTGWLAISIYWPNPLVWTASRRSALESEKACDDIAIDDTGCRIHYAENLLSLLQELKPLPTSSFALGFLSRKCVLLERVQYILCDIKARHYINRDSCVPSIMLAIALTVPISITSVTLIEKEFNPATLPFKVHYFPTGSPQHELVINEFKTLTKP